MGAVINFRDGKARVLALRKAAVVREIAAELSHWAPGGSRVYMAGLYVGHGWCSDDEAQLALEALGEK
jgi:hypothetical protein